MSKIPFNHVLNVGRSVHLYLHLTFLLLGFLGILLVSTLSFWHGTKSRGAGPIFGPPQAPRIESQNQNPAPSNELDPMVDGWHGEHSSSSPLTQGRAEHSRFRSKLATAPLAQRGAKGEVFKPGMWADMSGYVSYRIQGRNILGWQVPPMEKKKECVLWHHDINR